MIQHDHAEPFWDPVAQTLPRPELEALQADRLRHAVQTAYVGSGFNRRRFDAVGLRPDEVTTVADLKALLPIRKTDLRANEAEVPPLGDHRCVGLGGSVRLATSTGTTGRPTFALWTRADLDLDYDLAARAHWRAGLRPGQVIVNAHPGYLNAGQGMNAGAYEHMGILPISVGPPETPEHAERVLRTLEGLAIDHWRLFPAALARFREAAERIGSSITLPEQEAIGPRTQYDKLSAGSECISYLGSACAEQRGSHIAEDFAVVEVLDVRSREPVCEGVRGTMVVTSLGRENPMLRYDLEDVVRLESTPCPCGETSVRGFWEGRLADAVWIDDRLVLPIDVWMELPADAEFVLVRRPGASELEVRVEGPVAGDLRDRLATRCDVPVRVTSLEAGALSRAAYKAVRVVDEGPA